MGIFIGRCVDKIKVPSSNSSSTFHSLSIFILAYSLKIGNILSVIKNLLIFFSVNVAMSLWEKNWFRLNQSQAGLLESIVNKKSATILPQQSNRDHQATYSQMGGNRLYRRERRLKIYRKLFTWTLCQWRKKIVTYNIGCYGRVNTFVQDWGTLKTDTK